MAAAVQKAPGPVPIERLEEITSDACKSVFEAVKTYDHTETTQWNSAIINSILRSLLEATSAGDAGQPPKYKFAVTSTIIQHTSAVEAAEGAEGTVGGKRGMHSATGAYWNEEKDDMFNYKHEEDMKGFDVVITIIWMAST